MLRSVTPCTQGCWCRRAELQMQKGSTLCLSSAPSCSQCLHVVMRYAAGAVPMDALPSQQQMDGTRQHSWAQFAASAGGGTEPLGQQNSSHLMQALLAQRMESQGVALPGSTAGI